MTTQLDVTERAAAAPDRGAGGAGALARGRRSLVRALAPSTGLIGVWLATIVLFGILRPDTFLTVGTFKTIFGSQLPLVFLALALVVTFTVGEFDISVSATLGLSATLVADLVVNHGVPIGVAVVVAMAAAVLVGVVNATLVVLVGVNSIVTTLGMSTLLVGIAMALTDLRAVAGLGQDFARIANTSVLGLPISFYYGVALALFLAYVLGATALGRHMSFIGDNPEVARLAGIRVRRIRFGSYVAASTIAGVGGVLVAASVGGFDPQASTQYLLPSFAAAFLGTTAIVPGRFNPIGSLLAIYFLVTGIVGLQYLGYTGWVSQVFFGGALIVAVTLSRLVGQDASSPSH